MAIRRYFLPFILAAVLGAQTARAAVTMAEDLSGCKLPNDVKLLPIPGSPAAANGTLLKASNGSLGVFPLAEDGKVLSSDDAVARIRATNAGDLQYLADREGSLWAFSGKITELGNMYLADAASRPLEAPLEIPRTSRNPAGMYPGIREGRTYLVVATDGRYILLRVLEKTATGVVIQYVYQPGAGLAFEIPRNDPVTYHAINAAVAAGAPGAAGAAAGPGGAGPGTPGGDAAASAGAAAPAQPPAAANGSPPRDGMSVPFTLPPRIASTLPPPTARDPLGPGDIVEPGRIVLVSPPRSGTGANAATPATPSASTGAPGSPTSEASLDAMLHQREQMIQRRLAIVSAPTRSDAEVDRKSQAIYELTYLQANEAADVLVAQIAFLNTRSPVREFSPDALHPCFGALKRLGKPATAAALKGLKQLDLTAAGEGTESAAYKADLLGKVVRAVEGPDVAEFIFRRELDRETDPKRRAIFEYLLSRT